MMDLRGLKVVVGDSDRAVLELLQIRLDLAGYRATVARTGQDVLDSVKAVRPDAMIIDLALKEIDGFEVLQTLTRGGAKPPCPILVMGRKLAAEDIQRAAGLGARACMTKPFSGADVLERMARLLRPPVQLPPRVLKNC